MQETKGLGLYNVVIIGAGTAGLVTAAGTAALGGRVALVERNKMGGDCLNYGCVPSKALIASARVIESIRHASKWGLDEQEPLFEFETVFESMRSRRAKIAPHDSAERFESLGVDVFRGEAHFVSPHEIVVDGQTLHGKNFVIAAGSRAGIPSIEGIRGVPFFTNETIFDGLRKKPESMIVLGGGPYQFTHTADAQARLIVRNILMPFQILRQKMDYSVVPWCTYTAPEIAHVGLNEAEANQQNTSYDLIRVQIDELDRAVVESEELGFVKVLTTKGTDKILGVTLVATHAGDLLHEFVLAMKQHIGLSRLAATIHAYPTFAELGRKVGDHYNRKRLTPFAKKIFRWLYKGARTASRPNSARVPHAQNVIYAKRE
jgi:pyruvate/2-oxoglutarate dehydrogenase complex dihydrolipoamide dehydrogenase (E3) component